MDEGGDKAGRALGKREKGRGEAFWRENARDPARSWLVAAPDHSRLLFLAPLPLSLHSLLFPSLVHGSRRQQPLPALHTAWFSFFSAIVVAVLDFFCCAP